MRTDDRSLRFSSCQAEIAEPFCAALTEYIGERLATLSEYVGDIPWKERERLFYRGGIHACWVCGLEYVRTKDRGDADVDLLAAPVRSHPRYGGKPVYYSDLVVRAESGIQSFLGLSGGTCAINEPGSHSGCNVVRYGLAARNLDADHFGRIVESGSHRNSLRMLLEGEIDVAAIDSTVLELELAANPSMAEKIRTIETLGPSPAPPWVVNASVSPDLRDALRREFLAMDKDPKGRRILDEGKILRFAAVSDGDYDLIREMDRTAMRVRLP